MAATAKHIQLIITGRFGPLENGRCIYTGTALGGTEYETCGTTLEEDTTNSRFKMPEKWDSFILIGLLLCPWVQATQKLKLLAANTVTAKKSGLVEYETG